MIGGELDCYGTRVTVTPLPVWYGVPCCWGGAGTRTGGGLVIGAPCGPGVGAGAEAAGGAAGAAC